MNISNQGFTTLLLDNIQRLQTNQLQWMTQMGTGQKIQVPSDSPETAAILFQLQEDQTSLEQFQKNVAYAKSMTEGAYAGIERLTQLNTDLGTYTVKVSSLDKVSLPSLRNTINGYLEQAIIEANSKYLDRYLFAGSKTDTVPFTVDRNEDGKVTSVHYNGSTATDPENEFFIAPGVRINPVTDGNENEKILDILNSFLALRDAFDQEPPDIQGIQSLGEDIVKNNEESLINTMGSLGAKMTRVQHANDQNAFLLHDLEGLTSSYTDVDLAEVTIRLQQARYAYEAALQTGGKVLNLSLLNYLP